MTNFHAFRLLGTTILALPGIVLLVHRHAMAGGLFVDTASMARHAAGGPPPIVTPETILSPETMQQFRLGNLEQTRGVSDTVDDAKRPVKVMTQFDGAGDTKTYAARTAIKSAEGFAMGGYRLEDAGTYEGGGHKVAFGYQREVRQLVAGWTPNMESSFTLIGIQDDIYDEKQPHHGLDLLETDRKVGRAFFDLKNLGDDWGDLHLSAKVVDLDRRADNYSLRANSGVRMRVAVDRRIWEGQGVFSFDAGAWDNTLTFTGTYDSHVARRYNVTNGGQVNAVRIPDVDRDTLALNLETERPLDEEGASRLKGGLRFERVTTEPGAADETPDGGPNPALFNINPRTLYNNYYGVTDLDATDNNLSGRLRYEYDIVPLDLTLYGDLSRLTRSGDNVEKYHAVSGAFTSRWIGNPQIAPEKHNKAEIGFVHENGDFLGYQRMRPGAGPFDSVRISGSVYFDRIDDFISLDRARGQSGIQVSDGALVYRNIDADWLGATADLQWNPTRHWSGRANASWQYAENTTDNRALYQIAPLEADLIADYQDNFGSLGSWNAGAKLRLAVDQDRMDDDTSTGSGFDEHTGGFGVLDLYAGMQIYNRMSLSFGIDNVFDKDYREYIRGTHVDNPAKTTVYAPGRALWIRFSSNF